MLRKSLLVLSTAWFLFTASFLAAGAPAQTAAEAELSAAFEAARAAMRAGPTQVKLVDQAVLRLPPGYVFVPTAEAKRVLVAMGNRPGEGLLGVIFPHSESDENYFLVLRYIPSGYIKDDDAKEWNADDLLKNLREGTEEGNTDRRAKGIPEMDVVGWVEKPAYDAASQRLVWSIASRDKGAPAGAEQGVNYNTYALGREGYISMNLVTDLRVVEAHKPIARTLLAALEFDSGKRYGDFNASTDRVAEYGLAALVGGLAAKKLGVLAVIAAFAAKFAKVIAVAAIGGLAVARKLFTRKKEVAPPAA